MTAESESTRQTCEAESSPLDQVTNDFLQINIQITPPILHHLNRFFPGILREILNQRIGMASENYRSTLAATRGLAEELIVAIPALSAQNPKNVNYLKDEVGKIASGLIAYFRPWEIGRSLENRLLTSGRGQRLDELKKLLTDLERFRDIQPFTFRENTDAAGRLKEVHKWIKDRTVSQRESIDTTIDNYPTIEGEGKKDLPADQLDMVSQWLKKDNRLIPPQIIQVIDKWIIHTDPHQSAWGTYHRPTPFRKATVHLYPEIFQAEDRGERVLTHEVVGHGLDPTLNLFHGIKLLSFKESIEMQAEWEQIRKTTKDEVFGITQTLAANKSNESDQELKLELSREDFAESISFYILYPEQLLAISPKRYRFASKWLNRFFPAMNYAASRPSPENREEEIDE